MTTKFHFLALSFLLAIASWSRAELTVRVQPVQGGEGGYRAQPNDSFQWILAYYASGTSKQTEPAGHPSFGIFALDSGSAPLSPAETYHVSLKQQLRSGGQSGVSAATAFLYQTYATGDLPRWLPGFSYDPVSAANLQRAVWALERGETQLVPSAVSDLLLAHFGSWNLANETYRGSAIRIMTLTPASGGAASDHLVYLPDGYEPRQQGLPLIGYRNGGGGGGGGTPPVVVNPPPTTPPVVDPPDEFEDVDDDIVDFPPKTEDPQDDFTGSTPPGNPGNPPDPFNPPTNPPGEWPPTNPPPTVSVPDTGLTGLLLAGALVALAFGRHRLRR
jgi:hypothetical protein